MCWAWAGWRRLLLFTKRRQKGVVKQFCRMRRKGPGCPKTCVDCRISVGVTWTRSGLRTLWTGLEMMKECGPGVNILTLSKYYCFWVFLGALYCLVLGFWVSSKRCGLNVGISWYLVLSGSYFWGLSRRTMFLNGFGAGNVDKTADIEESTCSKTKKW